MCNSFHAGTRQFCHILFMLVSGCYFSISFLTAAMNIDSAFALCIKLTYCFLAQIFSCCYKTVLSHFVDGSVPLLVAECYLTMSVLHLHFKRLE